MYAATESLTSRFLHQGVIVKVPELGPIASVFLVADSSLHGRVGTLVLGVAGGLVVLIRSWIAIKTARSHT